MSDHKSGDDVPDLVARYLSGNASPTDVSALEKWVLQSPDHREQFLALKRAWMLSKLATDRPEFEMDQEWDELSKRLGTDAAIVSLPSKKRGQKGQWLKIAASIALATVLSLWLFNPADRSAIDEIVASETSLEHILGDGSKVSLNRQASLRYLVDHETKVRKVSLVGDAFFEIARDTARPFIISTQQVEIEVLGTSFYVDSRETENIIQVIVQSGSVALKHEKDEIFMSPGETGTYDKKNGRLAKHSTEDPNFLSWKSNHLIFNETGLDEVVFALNRHFQADLMLGDPHLARCRLTATYAGQSLPAVIRILEKTLNIHAEESNGKILLSGSGCED